MAKIDIEYHNLLDKILQEGYTYEDPNRKGVNRLEIPSYTFRHEFKDGFPAITTKKLNYKAVITELIWFLSGSTNIKYLVDNGCNIWNKDAYNYFKYITKNTHISFDTFIKDMSKTNFEGLPSWGNYKLGDLGPVYGHQWRKWSTNKTTVIGHNGHHNIFGEIVIDQISRLIKNLKEKTLATDHIVNAWNVGDLQDMALPPCHYGFQIVVRPLSYQEKFDIFNSNDLMKRLYPTLSVKRKNQLDSLNLPEYGFELHWQQRSVDVGLGICFNIASYATLALILEKITGYKALAIQGDLKKVHLYDNSLDAVKEQLSRDVNKYDKCELNILSYSIDKYTGAPEDLMSDPMKNWDMNQALNNMIINLESDDFKLENYESYPFIRVEMLERDE